MIETVIAIVVVAVPILITIIFFRYVTPPSSLNKTTKMMSKRSWITGNSKCKECYYEVVVTQPDNDNFPYDDYQWYCSNPKCKNHDNKIHTGDMEHPEWVELNRNKDER